MDFVPPELLAAAASMDRERAKIPSSSPPARTHQLSPPRRPPLLHAPPGHPRSHAPELDHPLHNSPPIFVASGLNPASDLRHHPAHPPTEPPKPATKPPEVVEEDLPVFLVSDPHDVFEIIGGGDGTSSTKLAKETTEPPLEMVTRPVSRSTLDVRLKYFGSTAARGKLISTARTTERPPSSTTRRKTTTVMRTTMAKTTRTSTAEATSATPEPEEAAQNDASQGSLRLFAVRVMACRANLSCGRSIASVPLELSLSAETPLLRLVSRPHDVQNRNPSVPSLLLSPSQSDLSVLRAQSRNQDRTPVLSLDKLSADLLSGPISASSSCHAIVSNHFDLSLTKPLTPLSEFRFATCLSPEALQ